MRCQWPIESPMAFFRSFLFPTLPEIQSRSFDCKNGRDGQLASDYYSLMKYIHAIDYTTAIFFFRLIPMLSMAIEFQRVDVELKIRRSNGISIDFHM